MGPEGRRSSCKDVLRLDDAEARKVKRWAIQALVEAANETKRTPLIEYYEPTIGGTTMPVPEFFAACAVSVCALAAVPALARPERPPRGHYLARIMDCTGCHTPGALDGASRMPGSLPRGSRHRLPDTGLGFSGRRT